MRNPRIVVVDRTEALYQQVADVTEELRPRPEVVACERAADFEDLVCDEGPFDVLIVGPSVANRSTFGRLAMLHAERPELSILLAFSERPDATLRDIVRTGAVDLVHLPVDDVFLQETIERAIDMSRVAASPSPDAGSVPPSSRTESATILTVASATGGSGKTVLATNAAYFLSERTRKRTCLVDLSLEFGQVASALRLRPRYTIVDLLRREDPDEEPLAQHIDEYLVQHPQGFHVLAAPKDPSQTEGIEAAGVFRVLQTLRSHFDYVVVDTTTSLDEATLVALDLADHIQVVTPLDLPSLRSMNLFLKELDRLKISSENRHLVANKDEVDVGVDRDQLEKLFPQGFSLVLPYTREVSKSLNLGTPILAYRPTSEFSRRLADGLARLLLPAAEATGSDRSASNGHGLLGRLLRRPPVARAAAP